MSIYDLDTKLQIIADYESDGGTIKYQDLLHRRNEVKCDRMLLE